MHDVFFDKTLLPLSPESISMTVPGRDEVVNLINFNETDIPRAAGLSEISFEIRLTNHALPHSAGRFMSPPQFIDFLKTLKANKSVFQFIILRKSPSGQSLGDTNISVRLAEYNIIEDARDGSDFTVPVTLREHRHRVVKKAPITGTVSSGKSAIVKTTHHINRWETTDVPKEYIIRKGDTLYNIGLTYYNNSKAWTHLVALNNLKNRDDIRVGQTIRLPEYYDIAFNNNKVS